MKEPDNRPPLPSTPKEVTEHLGKVMDSLMQAGMPPLQLVTIVRSEIALVNYRLTFETAAPEGPPPEAYVGIT